MAAKILRVAWWSITLGTAMELILLVVAAVGGAVPGLKPILADLVQKVSWSFLVCTGLAIGTAASKNRGAVMGLAGLASAPAAFAIARALHKSAVQALGLAAPAGGHPSPMVLVLIKAVEYAWLGGILAYAAKRAWGGKGYILIGLLTGVVCAGLVVGLTLSGSAKTPALAALMSKGVNELLFPVGCSLVLFAAESIGRPASPSA